MGDALKIQSENPDAKTLLIRFRGEFAGMDILEEEAGILAQFDKVSGGQVIFDLTETSYIDSAGITVIYKAVKKVQEHKNKLILMRPTPDIKKILTTAAVHKVALIYD